MATDGSVVKWLLMSIPSLAASCGYYPDRRGPAGLQASSWISCGPNNTKAFVNRPTARQSEELEKILYGRNCTSIL
jgi:hypothetical protein